MLSSLLVIVTASAAVALAQWRRRRFAWDVAAIPLLALLAAAFYWRVLLGDAYSPAGGGDLASFLYPYYAYAARSLSEGSLPRWNPYVWGGMPFIGDVQSGLFYPINLLQFLLRPTVTYADMQALAVLHVAIAGACTYACLRLLPGRPVGVGPALVGAVAFMFSDLFVVHFGNLNMIAVAAWTPLVFVLFLRSLHQRSLLPAAWAGAVLGLAALAGHIQPTLYTALLLALVAIWHAWRHGGGLPRRRLHPLAALALAGVVAVAVSAPATLPSLAISGETTRASFTYWQAGAYSLSPIRLIGLVLPDFFGRDPAVYWGLGDRVESGYIGLMPLLLAGFALAAPVPRRWVGLFATVAAAFMLLALGAATPLHGWLYALVPGMDLLRAPARAVYIADFAVAALAALALQALLAPAAPRMLLRLARCRVTVARYGLPLIAGLLVLSLLAVLMLQDRDPVIFQRAWTAANAAVRGLVLLAAALALLAVPLRAAALLSRRAWLTLVLLLTYLDLAATGAYLDLGPDDPTAGFHHDAAVAFLRSDAGPCRLDVDGSAAPLWQPNLGMLHGIEHVRGVANPMELERYRRYLALAGDRSGSLYDLLGAKYLVVAKGVGPGAAKFAPVFNADPQLDIYLNTEAMPLAAVSRRVVAVAGPSEAAQVLADPSFEADAAVVIEGPPQAVVPTAAPDRLWFAHRDDSRVVVQVELAEAGYLVLATPYARGWSARIDGAAATVLPANLAFIAVLVPAGEHSVEIAYSSPYLEVGSAAAVAALLATAAATAAQARRRAR